MKGFLFCAQRASFDNSIQLAPNVRPNVGASSPVRRDSTGARCLIFSTNTKNPCQIRMMPCAAQRMGSHLDLPRTFTISWCRPIMATIRENCALRNLGKSSVIVSRPSALLIAAIAACVVLQASRAQAQWWSRAPGDFEECADGAEKAAAKEARTGAGAVWAARTAGFRGMRRRRGEGGGQGSAEGGALGMQREIRRTPQARWRLQLFRFHAEPEFRYRGPEPDAGRTETYRRTIYRVSRPRAAKHHRGGVHGEAAAAAGTADLPGE